MSLALPVVESGVERHASARALFARIVREERGLAWTGAAHLALLPIFAALMLVDGRTVLGDNTWLKPAKFAASIGIYVLTVAALLLPLPVGRTRAFARWSAIAAMWIEMLAIAGQSARGVRSHFNDDSAADMALFALMGVAILFATSGAVALLVMHMRDRGLARPLAWGIRAGIAVSLLGSIVGGAMSGAQSHAVGAEDGDGASMAGTGWSREHGDMRVAHFAGLHALQVLPLVGLAMASRSDGARLVAGVAAGYALLVAALFAVALAGLPVVP